MKIKLKDGKELDVCFWSFAFEVFMAQLVFNIIILIVILIIGALIGI